MIYTCSYVPCFILCLFIQVNKVFLAALNFVATFSIDTPLSSSIKALYLTSNVCSVCAHSNVPLCHFAKEYHQFYFYNLTVFIMHHHHHHSCFMPLLAGGPHRSLHSSRSCAILVHSLLQFLQTCLSSFSLVFLLIDSHLLVSILSLSLSTCCLPS